MASNTQFEILYFFFLFFVATTTTKKAGFLQQDIKRGCTYSVQSMFTLISLSKGKKAQSATGFNRLNMGQHSQPEAAVLCLCLHVFQGRKDALEEGLRTNKTSADITAAIFIVLSFQNQDRGTSLLKTIRSPVSCKLIQTARNRWLSHLYTRRTYFSNDTGVFIFAATRHRADPKCHWGCHICSQLSPCSTEADPANHRLQLTAAGMLHTFPDESLEIP